MSTKIKLEIDSDKNITHCCLVMKYLDGKVEVSDVLTDAIKSTGDIAAPIIKKSEVPQVDDAFKRSY